MQYLKGKQDFSIILFVFYNLCLSILQFDFDLYAWYTFKKLNNVNLIQINSDFSHFYSQKYIYKYRTNDYLLNRIFLLFLLHLYNC